MSFTQLRTLGRVWVASAARTATGNSGALYLQHANSHLFILDATTVTGTSPTADVAIQVTHDNGTTFYSVLRFAQVTAAAKRYLRIQGGHMGQGEAGAEGAIADTGGALANNVVLSKKVRFIWTIGGTNPSFTFAINGLHAPKQSSTNY